MRLLYVSKYYFLSTFIMILLVCNFSIIQASSKYDVKESIPNKYKMGLNPVNEIEYEAFEKSELDEVFEKHSVEMPTKIDLSSDFPKPGHQGDQLSCVGWSVAYANKSYQEKMEHHWNLDTPDKIYSPSYIYNQINDGIDSGAYIEDAMQIAVEQGICTLFDMPYIESDYKLQPTEEQKRIAGKFKAEKWITLAKGDLNLMREHLVKGDAIVIGFPIFDDFLNLDEENELWDTYGGKIRGNHSVCVVGYDDEKQAFKVINSWGTEWGKNGFGWISYDMMKIFCVEAYVLVDIIQNGENASILPNNYQIEYNTLQEWNDGFTGEIEIENKGIMDKKGWYLEFDCEENIYAFWDADIVKHFENHYIIKGKTWCDVIPVNRKLKLGFIARKESKLNEPKNIIFK